MTNPIETAVAPFKSEAIAYGEQEAAKSVERILALLAEHDFDANAANPRPHYSNGTRDEFKRYGIRSTKIQSVSIFDKDRNPLISRYNGPSFVKADQNKIDLFIKQVGEAYGVSYEKFVEKLIHKIGAGVESASLEGNHVWGHSILTVTKADGSVERWKTQTILNFSVHGTPFNQWPTRKVK